MAITIQELLASDTISQATDKINVNFDQLLLNGGGPAGPPGIQGPTGPIGGRGIRGSIWYEGIGNPNITPPTAFPQDEDNYLESSTTLGDNGDVWTYVEASLSWVQTVVNLEGPIGPTGVGGKFSEYGAVTPGPYSTAGDTTIYPEPMQVSGTVPNGGIRATILGGTPETPAYLGPILNTQSVVPQAIAEQAYMPSVTLLLHQFNESGRSIIFHGGETLQNFEQVNIAKLSNIGISSDDVLEIMVPKTATNPGITLGSITGLKLVTLKRGQLIQSNKHVKIQTGGGSSTLGSSLEQDDFIVETGLALQLTTPKISLRVIPTSADASLELGSLATPLNATTKTGTISAQGGRISLVGTNQMNLRTGNTINAIAGQDVNIQSINADVNIQASTGVVDVDALSIDIDASTTIDITAVQNLTLQSTAAGISIQANTIIDADANSVTIDADTTIDITAVQDLTLWSNAADIDMFADVDIDIHTKNGDIHMYTTSGSGGTIFIDTDNAEADIKLTTEAAKSPIVSLTTGDESPIVSLTTGNTSPISISTTGPLSPITIQTYDTLTDINLTSAYSINLNSGRDTNITTGPFIGDVNIESPANDVNLTADNDVNITSTTNNVDLTAGDKIVLTASNQVHITATSDDVYITAADEVQITASGIVSITGKAQIGEQVGPSTGDDVQVVADGVTTPGSLSTIYNGVAVDYDRMMILRTNRSYSKAPSALRLNIAIDIDGQGAADVKIASDGGFNASYADATVYMPFFVPATLTFTVELEDDGASVWSSGSGNEWRLYLKEQRFGKT